MLYTSFISHLSTVRVLLGFVFLFWRDISFITFLVLAAETCTYIKPIC